jgi:hypothetical protein
MTLMLQRLARCQALADELSGQSMAGTDLLDAVCHLKLQCLAHARHDAALQLALEQFVQASEQCYRQCRLVYQTLYARVFHALGGPPPTPETVETVEIDPACALSVVQVDVQLTLYNDNETLSKLAPSELTGLPQSAEQCEALEQYYDEQALGLERYEAQHEALLQRSSALTLHGLQTAQQVARCRDALHGLGLCAEHEAVLALSVALDQLQASLADGVALRETQAANCAQQVDNACAKFLECGRLKEKLLRAYYLDRAHQRRTQNVAPLF